MQVDKVEDTVVQPWFIEALKTPNTSVSYTRGALGVSQHYWNMTVFQQSVMILAHMDVQHDLLYVILDAIRAVKGPNFPVAFITGHTHYRSAFETFSLESTITH